MSIPGLGTLPLAPAKPSTRSLTLPPLSEYRFSIPPTTSKPLIIRLLQGTAERDGVELCPNTPYHLTGPCKSKILSWTGCDLGVMGGIGDGTTDGVVQLDPSFSPSAFTGRDRDVENGTGGEDTEVAVCSYLTLHIYLENQREQALASQGIGPRVLVAGEPATGKTSLAKMLTAWATKRGRSPIIVNANPSLGILTLPGTTSAAVMATVMDVESEWGCTPSSGPSPVPIKLPVVQYYGREGMGEAPGLFNGAISRLARTVSGRMGADGEVRGSGVVVDSQGVSKGDEAELEALDHVVKEFSVNIILLLTTSPTSPLIQTLKSRFANARTPLNEPVVILPLQATPGVQERNSHFLQSARETAIKEYFFGTPGRTLSPVTQLVDFDSLVIYRNFRPTPKKEAKSEDDVKNEADGVEKMHIHDDVPVEEEEDGVLTRVLQPTHEMTTWCLAVLDTPASAFSTISAASAAAVVAGSLKHPTVTEASPEAKRAIQEASVLGFVYVADVDPERRKMKILVPVSERLGEHPLVWGRWPEPFVNLLG